MKNEYKWDLTQIFKNQYEFLETKKSMENTLDEIEKYKKILCANSENLYKCYSLYEKVLEQFERLYAYGMFYYHIDMSNQEGIKLFKEVEALGTKLSTKTSFITPEMTYGDTKKIEEYLVENKKLERYKRQIKEILKQKEHILSKEEENLLAQYSELFSCPENTFDILTNTEFELGTFIDENGNKTKLSNSNYSIYLKSKDVNVRKQVFNLMYTKYSKYINTITELYLANVKANSVLAKIRKYKNALENAVINDDASVAVYDSLIKTVNENMQVNHKYIDLKKKLLNSKEFHMYDLYVNPFEVDKDQITFEDAKKEVLEALQVMGEEYTKKLQEAFENNWIDVYAKQNKRGGAYSMGVYGLHPFVLMNFENSKRDVSTIAHELGHSMHSYYSNTNQTIIDSNYTILTAEVASTVNEILLSSMQIKKEQAPAKKAELLYELLEMIRATLFRQAMFAEFEKNIHDKIEDEQSLSSEDLNNIYYELNKKYFGQDIVIDEQIKYEWARIPHFYSDFYVYKYATGISCAISIATKILKNGEDFVNKYIEMLKQGCSKKSIELLKMVDINLEEEAVYQDAINFYKEKINELERLIFKNGNGDA